MEMRKCWKAVHLLFEMHSSNVMYSACVSLQAKTHTSYANIIISAELSSYSLDSQNFSTKAISKTNSLEFLTRRTVS